MGTEYTTTIWDMYFSTVKKAMKFAEKDQGKRKPLIVWDRKAKELWFSGDLLSHAYSIEKVVVEE